MAALGTAGHCALAAKVCRFDLEPARLGFASTYVPGCSEARQRGSDIRSWLKSLGNLGQAVGGSSEPGSLISAGLHLDGTMRMRQDVPLMA